MKKLLVALAAALATVASYGQGQVNFDNLTVGAPIFDVGGVNGPGTSATAALYLVDGANLTALTPTTTFLGDTGELAKYLVSTVVVVPGRDTGASATLRVRAWKGAANYDAAGVRGESNDVTVTLGGGTTVPPNLDGLQSFTLVPEPSTIALGVLGAAALLLRRRK